MDLWKKVRYYPLATLVLFVGCIMGITLSSLGLAGLSFLQTNNSQRMPVNLMRVASFNSKGQLSNAAWVEMLRQFGQGGEYIIQLPAQISLGTDPKFHFGVVDAILLNGPLIWQPSYRMREGLTHIDWSSPKRSVLLPTFYGSHQSVAYLWGGKI